MALLLPYASLAQLAEQRIRNAQVASSILAGSSTITSLESAMHYQGIYFFKDNNPLA